VTLARKKASGFIGLISDTHGLLRPQALRELTGARLICHAGDIGTPEIIASLKQIAPVIAVRGNNDRGAWAKKLPVSAVAKIAKIRIYLLHDLKELLVDPARRGFRVVVSGHSHRPSIAEKDGVLFVNPGSAGPSRFTLPVTVARLSIATDAVRATIVRLAV
jgi:uncharacterized protein